MSAEPATDADHHIRRAIIELDQLEDVDYEKGGGMQLAIAHALVALAILQNLKR